MRFYDPDQGQILIDGRDVRTIPPEELRPKFGVVFQNDFVAEGTIADNIRFFRPLTDEALSRAAEDAQALEFIQSKPGGMHAPVAVRGNNLSGGQKQRLLIARALAGAPGDPGAGRRLLRPGLPQPTPGCAGPCGAATGR